MKKFYYIAMLLSLAATNVAAEEFLPILESGKVWIYEAKNQAMHGFFETVHKKAKVLESTVSFDGVECREIEVLTVDSDAPAYKAACREADGVLSYFYDFAGLPGRDYKGQFITEVDFNVKEGDRLPIWSSGSIPFVAEENVWLTVDKIDVIEVKGIKRRRVSFANDRGCWVEGIGPSNSYVNKTVLWCCGGSDGSAESEPDTYNYLGGTYFEKMTECYLNGECIFTEADFRAPALTELREIDASDKRADGALYDLSGRRVDHPRRGQIYVSNGRKLRF